MADFNNTAYWPTGHVSLHNNLSIKFITKIIALLADAKILSAVSTGNTVWSHLNLGAPMGFRQSFAQGVLENQVCVDGVLRLMIQT